MEYFICLWEDERVLPVFGCCLESSPVTGYPGHPGGAALLFGFFLCSAGPGPLRTGGCWMVRQTTVAWRPLFGLVLSLLFVLLSCCCCLVFYPAVLETSPAASCVPDERCCLNGLSS